MTYWIIATDGRPYGPTDAPTIRRWIAEGRALHDTPIATSEHGPWSDLGRMAEFADAFPAADAGAAGAGSARQHAGTGVPPTGPAAPMPGATPADWPPQLIKIPVLVSGILNVLGGLGASSLLGLATAMFFCCGAIAGVPLLALGIVQLVTVAQARTTDPARWLSRVRVLAILDICTIFFGNVLTCASGIVVLTQIGDAERRIAGKQD